MKGTALLLNDEEVVTVLEGIGHDVYEEIERQKKDEAISCTIEDRKVKFGPVTKVIWLEEKVDWQYGY
jgi:hypothetical protein